MEMCELFFTSLHSLFTGAPLCQSAHFLGQNTLWPEFTASALVTGCIQLQLAHPARPRQAGINYWSRFFRRFSPYHLGMCMFLPQCQSLLIWCYSFSENLCVPLPLAQVNFNVIVSDNCHSFILSALFSFYSLVFFACLCSHPGLSIHPNKAHLCLTDSTFPLSITADFFSFWPWDRIVFSFVCSVWPVALLGLCFLSPAVRLVYCLFLNALAKKCST